MQSASGTCVIYTAIILLCFFAGKSVGRVLSAGNDPVLLVTQTNTSRTPWNTTPPSESKVLTSGDLAHITLLSNRKKKFSLDELQGSLVLINFLQPGCHSVCPEVSGQLLELRGQLQNIEREVPGDKPREVVLVSISSSPDSVGASELDVFVSEYQLERDNWHFAKTSVSNTNSLLNSFGYESKPLLYLFNHEGVLIQRYASNPLDIPRLTKELDFLRYSL